MSNKKIYRGLNKRRRFNFRKFITILICISIISWYSYKKLGLNNIIENINPSENVAYIVDKMLFWRNINLETFKLKPFDDLVDKQVSSNQSDETNSKEKSQSKSDTSGNTKVATVKELDAYLIQTGSFEDTRIEDLNNTKTKLNQSNIPNSNIKIDNLNKLQAYISFDENQIRKKLPEVKGVVNDAFITELKIPVLSLEYTDEYSYIGNISECLNDLLDNYKKESEYLNTQQDINNDSYTKIIEDRKVIVDKLESEVNKIDYKELNLFKQNLLFYTSQIKGNITNSLKYSKENNAYKVESYLMSSVQKYYDFIDVIKSS